MPKALFINGQGPQDAETFVRLAAPEQERSWGGLRRRGNPRTILSFNRL